MKKFLGVVCIILLAFLCGLGGIFCYAEDNFDTPAITRINNNSEVAYLYLQDVSAVCAGGDSVYIADSNKIYHGSTPVIDMGAKKMDLYGDKLLTLSSSGLYQGDTLLRGGEFSSFAAGKESIYFLRQQEIFEYSIDLQDPLSLGADYLNKWQISEAVSDIYAVDSGIVFWSNKTSEFYLFTEIDGTFEEVPLGIKTNLKQSFYAADDTLAILTQSEILLYKSINQANPILDKRITYTKNGKKICFDGNFVYVAATDGESYFIDKIDYRSASPVIKSYLASKGSANYFYDTPSGIFSRGGKIYVADSGNNRIAVLSGDGGSGGIEYITEYDDTLGSLIQYSNPLSAVALLNGDVIVAHQKNKLVNNTSGAVLEIKVSGSSIAPKIEKICIDFNNDIYVLASLGARNYVYRTNSLFKTPVLLAYNNPLSLGYKVGGGVAVYDDGAVRFINPDFDPDQADSVRDKKVISSDPLIDFCIDYSDNIFGLDESGLITVIKGTSKASYTTGGSYTGIAISTVTNAFAQFSDLLLLSVETHSLFAASGKTIGVDDISDHYEVSESLLFSNAHKASASSIAKTNSVALLFARPIESEINYSLNAGDTIFIRRDMQSPDNMYLAIAEDHISKALKWGYIYKSLVDTPLNYSAPAAELGKIHVPTAAIYKYPSSYSAIVMQKNSGDTVRLLSFASEYVDADGNEWLRVTADADGGYEGYIKPQFVSTSLFSGVNRLNANATIKNTTPLYVYVNGSYEIYDTMGELIKGTPIEVQTPFDSSKKYTKVLFYVDGQILDIDCYVLTADIAFEGLDIIQIVAVGVIVFTIILAIILTFALMRKRGKKKYNMSAYYDRE